jgi:hypothetical protein
MNWTVQEEGEAVIESHFCPTEIPTPIEFFTVPLNARAGY